MVLEARMAASRPPTRVATGASTPPDGLWADARRAFERWLDDDPAGPGRFDQPSGRARADLEERRLRPLNVAYVR